MRENIGEICRTRPATKILAKHCRHHVRFGVEHPPAFNEIIDWIEEGMNGCRGYFYTIPETYLHLIPKGPIDFYFECPATAMMVKVRWA